MSSARRPREMQDAPACAAPAQNSPPVQRQSTSPSSRTIALPQTGHLPSSRRYRSNGSPASAGRRSATTPTTSGITSPARRTITVSPMRTSLRWISSSLCSVALLTVVPPTNTGSSLATGVSLPVRPTWMSMPRSTRRLLLRRVLVRDRPARLARDEAEPLLQLAVVDLVDHAVDVVRQRVALRRDRGDGTRPDRRRRATDGAVGLDREAHRRRARRAARSASAASPSRGPRPGRRRRS